MEFSRSAFPSPVEQLTPADAMGFFNRHPGFGEGRGWNNADRRDILPRSQVRRGATREARLSNVTREEIAANIAASEARTDTKFARVDARFDAVNSRFDAVMTKLDALSDDLRGVRDDNRHTRSTVRNSTFALAGLFIAVVALAIAGGALLPNAYSFGLSTRDIIQSEVQKATTAKPAGQ